MNEMLLLLGLGALFGAILNYFHFGFSSGFKALLTTGDTRNVRAQIWMLATAFIGFSFVIANSDSQGFIRPISLAIPVGALIFGIGMQLAHGCTSGTLNRVGQLRPMSLITLLWMIVGGVIAAYFYQDWNTWPKAEPVSLGFLEQGLIFAGLYWLLLAWERRRLGHAISLRYGLRLNAFLWAGLALAMVNTLHLALIGQPWSVASVFPFWGLSAASVIGLPIEWDFWDYAMTHESSLSKGLFEHTVSLTTLGLIAGSLFVTLVDRRPRTVLPQNLWLSMIGGLLMGIGAVMASGCNIGAFFSGIASGGAHGWVWLMFALMGNWLGLKLIAVYSRRGLS